MSLAVEYTDRVFFTVLTVCVMPYGIRYSLT